MNGATADPWESTMSAPKSNKTIIMGASQNFFRTFINPQRSFSNSIIRMVSPFDVWVVQYWVFDKIIEVQ